MLTLTEALNSVLDDNRLLTLPNGERIQFGKNVNFIFETVDLKHASPATISRMGVIFLSPEDVKEMEVVKARIKHQTSSDDIASMAIESTDRILRKAVNWIEKHPEFVVAKRPKVIRLLDSVAAQNWRADLTREEFVIKSFRNLSSGLTGQGRQKLAEKVLKEIGLSGDQCIRIDENGNVMKVAPRESNVVQTASLLANSEFILQWIKSDLCKGK